MDEDELRKAAAEQISSAIREVNALFGRIVAYEISEGSIVVEMAPTEG